MRARGTSAALILALALAAFTLSAAPASAQALPLTIFNADSLTGYVRDLVRAFAPLDPGVAVRREASGSLDAIRKASDLGLPCDIVIAADWRLLARPRKALEPWVVIFAGNRMGLVYTSRSRGAASINAKNWYRVLTEGGVRYGHSDPTRDPAGYWTLILWQLSERHYHQPGLAARLAAHCPRKNIRPDSLALIALLESGDLDYYFGYASDARLGSLKFLALPPAIDLGDIARRSEYAAVSVEIGSGAHHRRVTGGAIAYGATLTANPPNRAAALKMLELMVSAKGAAIAARNGLVAYKPPLAFDPHRKLPPELRTMVKPLDIGAAGASNRQAGR